MGHNDDIELKDGRVPYYEFLNYLQTMTSGDLDDLYEYSLHAYSASQKVIDNMEDMKGKYDVCAVDEFFQVLLNTTKILNLSSYIAKSLSPIGLKSQDFELFRVIEKTLKDFLNFTDSRNNLFIAPIVLGKLRAFPYEGNFKLFIDFLEKFPGIMQTFFKKNPVAFKEVFKYYKQPTLSHQEESRLSDLVFYLFYAQNASADMQDFRILEGNKFMDFRDRAMSYFVDEDGHVDFQQVPYDTSCLPALPDEKIAELKDAETKSFEVLRYLKEKVPVVKSEFEHYGNLVASKYELPPMLIAKYTTSRKVR